MQAVDQKELELAIQVVRQLLREGRLSEWHLSEALSEAERDLIEHWPAVAVEESQEFYQHLISLFEKAAAPTADSARIKRKLVGASVDATFEVLDVELLLLASESKNAVRLLDTLDQSHDARFRVRHVRRLEDLAEAARALPCDVILVDLTGPDSDGLATLARADVAGLPVPLVPIIESGSEAQALHMGLRNYLVHEEVNARLMVRTVRSALESHSFQTDLRSAREREQFHATRDSMTGIPNRHHFRERLSKELDRAARDGTQVWVLFMDLDRFKRINDSLGHAAGDKLILTVAERLSHQIRSSDMVARVGGDEFLLMLHGATLGVSPENAAQKLLETVAAPVELGKDVINSSGTIGIASFPEDGLDSDTLIRNADQALYAGKAKGRGGFTFYSQSQDAAAARRFAVESKLRKAIDRDQLEVYYQPRVRVDLSGETEIIGSEALLRWFDPELGQIEPYEFVRIAEESGLIVTLGEWVMRAACHQHREWIDAGFSDLQISINVSPRQIQEGVLKRAIMHALWDAGLQPGCVEIEITESAFIDSPEVATRVFRELSEIGLGLALDDFGTGYSSLSYLKRFPVDTIKIDQSFVFDALMDQDDASIIEAMVSIGEKLGLKVVAEGVQTKELRDFLLSRGCREMQGFLWSPPVPALDMLELLKADREKRRG